MTGEDINKYKAAFNETLTTEWDWYVARIEQKAKILFYKIVKPFCRDRKWRFRTGIGTWAFFPPNHAAVSATKDWTDKEDPEMDAICELLSIEIPGMGGDLGELMPECKDYTYAEEE